MKRVLLLLACVGAGLSAYAHPISMTQTEAYANRDKLKVSIELFVEDLFLFHNLVPTDENFLRPDDLRGAMEKHKAFLLERFTVRDADGNLIPGTVVKIDECAIGEKGIPMTDLMAHSLVYHIEYPMPPGGEFLTLSQSLGTTQFGFPAIMLLRLKQEGSDVPYVAEMRTNEPHTVRLDWEHPPLSPEASEKEWEDWDAKRREKALGITSYSSVYSFLYIEDHQVRHEVLVPLLTLEGSVPIERREPDFLDVDEQDKAMEAIAAYFQKANPIHINGELVTPTVDRIDFYGLDFRDFAQKADRRRVSMVNARVGVILTYPFSGSPENVELTWDMFNKFVWGVQTVVFAFDQNFTQFFSPYQKKFQWTNPGRPPAQEVTAVVTGLSPLKTWTVPVASLVCAAVGLVVALMLRGRPALAVGGLALSVVAAAVLLPVARVQVRNPFAPVPRLDDDAARLVFNSLLQNVYRSFEYPQEERVYDTLARSMSGPLLEKTYLGIKQGLVMREQGGAVARVGEVSVVSAKRAPVHDPKADPRGFDIRAVWDVSGTVEHWGHIHTRVNEYEATFTVLPEGKNWKIAAMDVTGEKRKSFTTKLRNFQ